jgi:hypothetical protein
MSYYIYGRPFFIFAAILLNNLVFQVSNKRGARIYVVLAFAQKAMFSIGILDQSTSIPLLCTNWVTLVRRL